MMWLVVALALFLILVALLLFAPIELLVNTVTNQYYIRVKGLAKATIEGHPKELLRIRLRMFFREFYFYPLRGKRALKGKKEKQKKSRRSSLVSAKKALRILRSFETKKFLVDLDTGNCILNAKLFPLFGFLNFYVGSFHINFEGRNRLIVHLQNRPVNIIKSFINY